MSGTIRFGKMTAALLFTVVLALGATPSYSGEIKFDLPEMPPANSDAAKPAGKSLDMTNSGESKKFDGGGRIDRIGEEELVINDLALRLSKNINYRSVSGSSVSAGDLKVGALVRYKLNGKREIISLLLIDKKRLPQGE